MERTIPAEDREAQRIYDTYHTLVRTVVSRILDRAGTPEDAEECTQDVLWEFLQGPDKWDPSRGSEKTYLCMLARSRAKNRRNRASLAVAHLPKRRKTDTSGIFHRPNSSFW